MQELARALAHLLEAERQERARAEAQEAEDQQARVLAQLLRAWGAPRASDPAPGLEDDPEAPAAQLARALLRARLDPAALAAQLVPAPAPAAALRPRPPVYDDGPVGPEAEDASDDTPDVDPELLRCPSEGGRGRRLRGAGPLGGSEDPHPGAGAEVLCRGDSGERDSWSRGGGSAVGFLGGGTGRQGNQRVWDWRPGLLESSGLGTPGCGGGCGRPGPPAVWGSRAIWVLGPRRYCAGTFSLPPTPALLQVLVGADPRRKRGPRGCGCPAPSPPSRGPGSGPRGAP